MSRPRAAASTTRAATLVARVGRARPAVARAQATWIVDIEPWHGLGYTAARLGRWLARAARDQEVWIARARGARAAHSARTAQASRAGAASADAILVLEAPFLLGGFIALLAVRPSVAGRGIGRALIERARRRIFTARGKRWLYVSADSGNRAALAFYRRLGFSRVGRLPDLIRPGNTEILLRQGRGGGAA